MSTSTPKITRSRFSSVTASRTIDLIDPRSPTTEFQRTPIQVVTNDSSKSDEDTSILNINTGKLSVSFVSSSKLDDYEKKCETSCSTSSFVSSSNDLSISCVDLSSEDVSVVVSDMSVNLAISEGTNNSSELVLALEERFENVKLQDTEKLDSVDESNSYEEGNDTINEKKPLIKKPAKKLFYTPNKKRNPLGAVDNICPITPTSALGSPQNIIREKQWKRIQEERKKLGFESDENFQIPLYDVTASAPSKLMLKRKSKQYQSNFS